MVKGIINAFDYMELCFVINLTKDGNWAITGHQYLLLGFAVTFLYQVARTCYLPKIVTVKILKIGTPEIITIIVLQLEQLDFTVQHGVQKMQTE